MRLLDLYCCQGGAAEGYRRAGYEIVMGVDVRPQPRYPFPFTQADALAYLRELIDTDPHSVDAIHASPPCQLYSSLNAVHKKDHPDLVAPTRELLREWGEVTGGIWIMENVPGSPLENFIQICGGGLGLGDGARHLQRHRWFESNVWLWGVPCSHPGKQALGVYGHGTWDNAGSDRRGGYQASKAEGERGMGIDWMNQQGLSQAIPPAYTEHLGVQMLEHGSKAA